MALVITGDDPAPAAVERLLRGLPEWFGIEAAVDEYVADAGELPTLIATDEGGTPVGALVHRRHFPETTEIHVLAVERTQHRRGIGRALIEELARAERGAGVELLSVKTLGPSDPDPGYAATRAFYRACGFLPVEEINGLWPGNPCLIMVRSLVVTPPSSMTDVPRFIPSPAGER